MLLFFAASAIVPSPNDLRSKSISPQNRPQSFSEPVLSSGSKKAACQVQRPGTSSQACCALPELCSLQVSASSWAPGCWLLWHVQCHCNPQLKTTTASKACLSFISSSYTTTAKRGEDHPNMLGMEPDWKLDLNLELSSICSAVWARQLCVHEPCCLQVVFETMWLRGHHRIQPAQLLKAKRFKSGSSMWGKKWWDPKEQRIDCAMKAQCALHCKPSAGAFTGYREEKSYYTLYSHRSLSCMFVTVFWGLSFLVNTRSCWLFTYQRGYLTRTTLRVWSQQFHIILSLWGFTHRFQDKSSIPFSSKEWKGDERSDWE